MAVSMTRRLADRFLLAGVAFLLLRLILIHGPEGIRALWAILWGS